MNKILLATKRPWNWKVFFVLVGLIIPAVFAVVPFSLHLIKAYGELGAEGPGGMTIVTNALINGLLISALGTLGLLITNRIGLGLPFIEGWIKRKPGKHSFLSAVAIGWIAAVGFAAAILLLQNFVFGPPMQAMFQEIGYVVPEDAVTPPLYGFLAAISAGITEEVIFRLFGLSLLAWLGSLAFKDSDGRPRRSVLWAANIILALAFGAAHLSTAATIGWPINALVITRTVILNAIGGITLGWLFWTFGLETAMLAHFLGDVIIYTLLPIIAIQEGETARYIAGAGVLIFCILGLVWAWRILVKDRQGQPVLNEGTAG
jgi:membrane protease YdiL (CAAX protease family)